MEKNPAFADLLRLMDERSTAASVRELLDALREAGPDRECWTWWGSSQSPQTGGAVARHQLQQLHA